jgi:hypothetical protein
VVLSGGDGFSALKYPILAAYSTRGASIREIPSIGAPAACSQRRDTADEMFAARHTGNLVSCWGGELVDRPQAEGNAADAVYETCDCGHDPSRRQLVMQAGCRTSGKSSTESAVRCRESWFPTMARRRRGKKTRKLCDFEPVS